MLETHDPKWASKWDRVFPRVQELNRKGWFSADEAAEYRNLSALLCTICDAEHRTPNEYIRLHLSLTLQEADRLGIWAWLPTLPDNAGIDATQAAVTEVNRYVERVRHRRELFAVCRRAGVKPQLVPDLPKLNWRIRWAMLRFRVGRGRRNRSALPF